MLKTLAPLALMLLAGCYDSTARTTACDAPDAAEPVAAPPHHCQVGPCHAEAPPTPSAMPCSAAGDLSSWVADGGR